jgi:hypothetical protein
MKTPTIHYRRFPCVHGRKIADTGKLDEVEERTTTEAGRITCRICRTHTPGWRTNHA